MITALSARDFVLFETLEVELGPGLNVISGGSGEGKSLLLQALRFGCGEGGGGRAAAERWVRPGAPGCRVELSLELPAAARAAVGLPEEGPLRLARALTREGRTRCWVGDQAVSLQELRRVGVALVEAFTQGAAGALAGLERQRATLDAYAGLTERAHGFRARRADAAAVAEEAARLEELEARLRAGWAEGRSEREALAELAPAPGEFGELCDVLARLEQRVAERNAVAGLVARLDGHEGAGPRRDEGLLDRLLATGRELDRLAPRWPELAPAGEAIREATALVEDAAGHVRGACDGAPEALDALAETQERVQAYRALARRLRLPPEGLAARWSELEEEGDPEAVAERRAAAEARLATLRRGLHREAEALRAERTEAAARLAREATAELEPLGLSGARVEVRVEPVPCTPAQLPGPEGLDRVEVLFAAAGAPPAPLEQASGGELSRLALVLGARAASGQPVLLFDEVDQNVGARLGGAVGACLADLARHRQVIAVTHLAPVAALAARHLRLVRGGDRTAVARLEGDERLEELALMIRGEPITRAALEQARELLQEAEQRARPPAPPRKRGRPRRKRSPRQVA